MRGAIFLAFALAGLASTAAVTTQCNADNCLRQVRATAFTTRAGAADCSAYQTTYSATTSTVTVTSAVAGPPIAAPTTTPRTIPAYASGCAGDAAYRSACSCNGQTSTVIPAPVVYVTTTVASAQPAECTTFVLRQDTRYVELNGEIFFLTARNPQSALKLRLDGPQGMLAESGSTSEARVNANDGVESPLRLSTAFDMMAGSRNPLLCSISAARVLSCKTSSGNSDTFFRREGIFQLQFGPLSLASQPGSGLSATVITAEAYCPS